MSFYVPSSCGAVYIRYESCVTCSEITISIGILVLQELDTTLQVLGIDERGEGSSVRLTTSQNASVLPSSSRSRAMSRDLENIEATLMSRLRYSRLSGAPATLLPCCCRIASYISWFKLSHSGFCTGWRILLHRSQKEHGRGT